jgi:hypothetical protein
MIHCSTAALVLILAVSAAGVFGMVTLFIVGIKSKACCPPNLCDCDQDGGDHFE